MLTNEENRVEIYATSEIPTIASEITATTPLESLNLNWREKDLPENERTKHVHRLHPYLGKFIPQIVEIFLRKYFVAGQTILDPFCGSGTTLVQANELGINSIGCDISAFNVLLCQAKTTHYDLPALKKEVLDILEKTRRLTQTSSQQLSLWEDEPGQTLLSESDSAYLNNWFAPPARQELLTYRQLIESEGYINKGLLKIILSRSARSARMTTHFDLDFPKHPQIEPYWCYKHSRNCYPTTEAFKFLKRYSVDTIERVTDFKGRSTEAKVTVLHTDSRNTKLPPIDGVITSPPYVGLIDYHEQHAYAYHLLGLEDKRALEIGAALNGSSQKAKQKYQSDIAEVFSRTLEVMASGGRLIVIAGDRANLYPGIAGLLGVEVEAILQRHVNRRTGRRSSEFYESIFIWRKP